MPPVPPPKNLTQFASNSTGIDSTSLLHLHFLYFSHSRTAHFYFCLPSILCLPPTFLSLSVKVCHWNFICAKWKKFSFSTTLSSVSHPFLSLPFYQPRLSHPQHHCWSWILCCFQANAANLPLLLPSLPILTLFHLTWLFTHWCSDTKVTNSQQIPVCFNWRTLEILQEETGEAHFSWSVRGTSLLVFDSTWSWWPLVQKNLNINMKICLHFLPKCKTM